MSLLPRPGQRVVLRRLRAADLAAFQAYRGDPEVGRWQGWTPMDDAAAAAFLDEMAAAPVFRNDEWFQLAIADAASDTLLGDIGLHLAADASAVEIGFTLAGPAQGRGLANEAVALAAGLVWAGCAAARIVAITDTRNEAALRLLDRLGFRRGAVHDALFRGETCREQHFELRRGDRLASRA